MSRFPTTQALVPIAQVQEGTKLRCDSGFTCMSGYKTVEKDEDGLYVRCRSGKHYLDGQRQEAKRHA